MGQEQWLNEEFCSCHDTSDGLDSCGIHGRCQHGFWAMCLPQNSTNVSILGEEHTAGAYL